MKKKMAYQWKLAGGEFAKHDAAIVGAELEAIRRKHGKLDPSDVVEASRDPESPLHAVIPWDDDKAAAIGRMQIARSLIRSVVVTIITPANKPILTRAFISMPRGAEQKRTYEHISVALASEEGRDYLVRKAWQELMLIRQRYSELTELAELWGAIDRAGERRKKTG